MIGICSQRRQSHANVVVALAVVTSALASGCTGASGTQPDDMGAATHREHAGREGAKADEAQREAARRAAKAAGEKPRPYAYGLTSGYSFPVALYNPTDPADRARHHRELAARHRAAAEALERFERGTCAAFPPRTRAVCPVARAVSHTQHVDGGLRLFVRAGLPLQAVVAHMRCHHAYGRTRAFAGMPDCPLYIKGLRVRADRASRSVDLTVDDRASVRELRRRAATHFACDRPAPPSPSTKPSGGK